MFKPENPSVLAIAGDNPGPESGFARFTISAILKSMPPFFFFRFTEIFPVLISFLYLHRCLYSTELAADARSIGCDSRFNSKGTQLVRFDDLGNQRIDKRGAMFSPS